MRRTITILAAAALACAAAAPAASAGQIVWVAAAHGGGTLWAANDDGTYPHKLLEAASSTLASQLPAGTISEPDTFQNGGSTVVFTDSVDAYGAPTAAAVCSSPCSRTLSLAGGALSSDSPTPAPAGASFESQPRLSSRGQIAERYTLYPDATSTSLGTPAVEGIFERSPTDAALTDPWADTATETLPVLADPAPDPADPSLLAWVEDEDPTCAHYIVHGAAVCQYAIHVASAAQSSSPPVAIFDDEAPGGSGPSSLSWSSNGSDLLIVDDQPPNDGIYEVSSSTKLAPASKTVTELIAQPAGWTFGQARFAGSKVVFSAAGEGRSVGGTSDIYAISAGCTAGTCSFPESAKNLTHNPSAENIDPTWTSAAAPLAPLGDTTAASAPPTLDAAAIMARTVTPAHGVSFEVTLSRAGSLEVSISRDGHTIGYTTERLQAGATTFTIKKSGGHALTRGPDVAKLRVGGSSSIRYSAAFKVR